MPCQVSCGFRLALEPQPWPTPRQVTSGALNVETVKAAAGVVLIHVDLGKLLEGDRVGQAGGKTQAGHVKAGAGQALSRSAGACR